jgi:hypothetical protein
MAINWSASFVKGSNWSRKQSLAPSSSSSQYAVSSSSCMPPSILLMKSGLDLARCASRKCAPTEVPDLNSWSPRTWASLLFGNWEIEADDIQRELLRTLLEVALDSSVFSSHLFIFGVGISSHPSVLAFHGSSFFSFPSSSFRSFPPPDVFVTPCSESYSR